MDLTLLWTSVCVLRLKLCSVEWTRFSWNQLAFATFCPSSTSLLWSYLCCGTKI